MKNFMCTRCHKRPAVIFMSRMENGQMVNEGLCLQCAKELGIPQVKDLIDRMGISDEDIESMSNQIMDMMGDEDGFEPGGAMPFPMMNMFGGPLQQEEENLPAEPEEPASDEPGTPAQEKKRRKMKYLDSYCENLNDKVRQGKVDRIIGRDSEIYRVMQILNRRTKNNPCLIGEPGVGKTAIAEGIAQRLVEGKVPPSLLDKEIWLLDLTALVAGTQFRGQFESRVKGLVEDVKKAGNVILFIDEIHNLVGAGDAEGSMNAANILKPALSRGEIQVIGATTFDEYRSHIEKDAALERRFQPVTVNEPSIEDSVQVLEGIKQYYENYHHVKISDEIVRRCVVMAERYITDRYLPDKAIDLMDEAASCCNMENKKLIEYSELSRKLERLDQQETEMQQAENVDYEKLAELRSERLRLKDQAEAVEQEALSAEVTVDHVAKVIELWTGIPASKIKETELAKVAGLADALKKKVIGQDEAVDLVAAAIRRSRVQISPRRRPASFIFVGPTGVGKTELVKVLASELFDTADPLIRLDMSEYMEKHSVSKIVGSPPGYVGYDEAGQLTEKVRRKPYSVVLFDEIEKAHPDVLNILLQILDEGRITDSHGRTVSFENTVIVMTSNAGSNVRSSAMGFNRTAEEAEKNRVMKALGDFLRPEFLGRVDEIVVFRALDENDYTRIAGLLLDEIKGPMQEKGILFGYDEDAARLIARKSFGDRSGGRAIRRTIRREVEDRIAELLVERAGDPPAMLKVTAGGDEIRLTYA
ncbi:ATP-dependent Clp protease ATP-binding subunit [Hydrogenoanaerobacterium saccharovorans]|uniref:ATP-dependent Clp protease ATP-binding subunit n=1 Tax=Hydrogenoanaerobacterium saccharovorans TaxID=474960 RepID=A0ABS2GPM3_9FIRM|nr:ATP-dependent Clp protease ATP-binding subunit [Hydrogenoanaerobacterium saccharovorans]MBM6923334.1 ATP-dependent Clp protease ATP-binding subunit [Hydrogenoanaerobacterium saccharovorans]